MFLLSQSVLGLAALLGAPAAGMPAVSLSGSHLSTPVPDPAGEVSGTVKSADMEAKTFLVVLESGAERRVSWNDGTVFLLDGEKSDARTVLVTDGKIRASVGEDGVATSVSRWTS